MESRDSKIYAIQSALNNNNGKAQRIIAEIGIDWLDLLLRKNKDYGDSIFRPMELTPDVAVDAAIRIRMSDKIARLRQLMNSSASVKDETVEDTVGDLGSYCLLLLVQRQNPLEDDLDD